MIGKPTSILAVAALSLLVVVTAGCGGKSKSAATTQTAATTTATTPAATTTMTTTAATTTAQTSPSSGLSSIATAGNCGELASLGASFSQAFSGAVNSADIQKEAVLLKEFADRTPSAIRPDFEVVAAAYAKIANALKGVNLTAGSTPSASDLQKLEALGTEINQQQLQKASSDIAAWAEKNCTHP